VIKHLTKHGNSLALVIDKPILDLLGIDADTPLEVWTDGAGLHVKPVRRTRRDADFKKAWEAVKKRYGNAFRRLAD
jgi:antitoxin component of MazEF toxin-antitoxin module